jgi:Leucine-rich repeat (LRR) protein
MSTSDRLNIHRLPMRTLCLIHEFLGTKDSRELEKSSMPNRVSALRAHEIIFYCNLSSKTLSSFLVAIPNLNTRYTKYALAVAERQLLSTPSAAISKDLATIAKIESARNLIAFFHALETILPELVKLPEVEEDLLAYAEKISHWMEQNARLLGILKEDLDISNRHLTAIPDEIGYLKNITGLDASDNALVTLPLNLCDCSQLRYLFLDNNRIESLPSSIGRLLKLKQIDIRGNRLRYLPTCLGFLPELKYLDLSSNRLTILPDSFTHLKKLTTLDLDLNYLRYLPEDWNRLKSLSSFSVSANLLESLPDEFGDLPNVLDIDLSFNRLVRIPKSFSKLTALTKLNLSENRLTTLPKDVATLTHLISLNVSMNEMQYLPQEVWATAVKISQLKIYGNPFFAGIPDDVTAVLARRY